jgi:hypothetical protein
LWRSIVSLPEQGVQNRGIGKNVEGIHSAQAHHFIRVAQCGKQGRHGVRVGDLLQT